MPKVKLFSIDIDLSQREFIYKDVTYLSKDISFYTWKNINKKNCLIIFDDHVCFSKRISFLLKQKFKHIVFDDNLPNNFIGYYTPKMIVEKSTIIKISGIDKDIVGKIASEIKKLKPVEPYKGKGIKERGQFVRRKEGKKK